MSKLLRAGRPLSVVGHRSRFRLVSVLVSLTLLSFSSRSTLSQSVRLQGFFLGLQLRAAIAPVDQFRRSSVPLSCLREIFFVSALAGNDRSRDL